MCNGTLVDVGNFLVFGFSTLYVFYTMSKPQKPTDANLAVDLIAALGAAEELLRMRDGDNKPEYLLRHVAAACRRAIYAEPFVERCLKLERRLERIVEICEANNPGFVMAAVDHRQILKIAKREEE